MKKPIGPAAPPGLAAPAEHLPCKEHAVLRGHDGPVLAVRFNRQGTYCLSCGKASWRGSAAHRGPPACRCSSEH